MSTGIYNKLTGYHNRRSIRLPGYDYSQPGYYFVTICIHNRKKRLFGDVIGGKMVLNEMGIIAIKHIKCLPERFSNIKLDAFQIMPNHVHAVIPIHTIPIRCIPVGATLAVAHESVAHESDTDGQCSRAGASPAPIRTTGTVPMETTTGKIKNITIGDIIGAYKSLVSNECLKIYKSKNERMGKLWQRNYYERIIRDEKSLFFVRKYIRENPVNWDSDSQNHIDHEIQDFEMSDIGGAK